MARDRLPIFGQVRLTATQGIPAMVHGKADFSKVKVIRQESLKNILTDAGRDWALKALSSGVQRQVGRMAIGDGGVDPTAPNNPLVPQQNVQTTTTSSVASSYNVSVLSVTGITKGQFASGAGIPASTTVTNVSGTTVTLSNLVTVANGITLTFSLAQLFHEVYRADVGSVSESYITLAGTLSSPTTHQATFTEIFSSLSIPTTPFLNPSSPVVNEVGLILLNPTASAGPLPRTPVVGGTNPPADELLFSIRTFPSVPFLIGLSVALTVEYTLYVE